MPDADVVRVVELAGGVGGAKLAFGLQAHLGDRLTVVVNTGDDLERHGLLVCPDHDTVMYTLAGIDNREWGWGIAGETFAASEMLARLGEETWFRLGDRDLATHVVRTRRLREGERLTTVLLGLQAALGVRARILPMADEPIRTAVRTDEGWLDFQTWFVRRHQEPEVGEIRFGGIEGARVTPEVAAAFDAADAIVVAPSNPFVSVAPILAVPGMRDAIDAARSRGVPVAAISGIVGGRAIKGPADRMLASLGGEASALGVARRYQGWVDLFVLDVVDAALEPAIRALGFRTLVTDTLMVDDQARTRLAGEVLGAVGAPRSGP
ncbi:MAG TPA: 2-phospho-L-lactate transferase [Candidatus Sulfomarinibacteraceae bacterium]|nr:2-phospho-L-lactate transferase [Candidatus Sulfomarinibacteraceae bacterium]